MVMEVVNVSYANQRVGAVSFDSQSGYAAFEYTSDFINRGIQLSPLKMPLYPINLKMRVSAGI